MNVYELADFAHRLKPIEPGTYKLWLNAVDPIGELAVSDIDEAQVTRYRMERLKPWGSWCGGTLKMRLASLQSIWNVGIKAKLVDTNPWLGQGADYTKSKRKYTQQSWNYFHEFHKDPMFLCIWHHGMRLGEIGGILPEEIVLNEEIPYFDLKHNKIRKLKNEESVRQVPIHPACIPFVNALKVHSSSSSYSPGDMWSRKLKRRTGYPAHSLRHNFINRMRKAGVEYSIAMRLVGHTPQGTTADYGDVFLEDLEQAVLKVGELQKLR
jgi:integrase